MRNSTDLTGERFRHLTVEGVAFAALDGSVLSLDFVEFWHTPAKHVPYTGTKI